MTARRSSQENSRDRLLQWPPRLFRLRPREFGSHVFVSTRRPMHTSFAQYGVVLLKFTGPLATVNIYKGVVARKKKEKQSTCVLAHVSDAIHTHARCFSSIATKSRERESLNYVALMRLPPFATFWTWRTRGSKG